MLDILTSDNLEEELDYCREELFELKYWLSAERFDCHAVNRRVWETQNAKPAFLHLFMSVPKPAQL